jgi:biopolymer transport protein ExbD
MSMGGPSGGGHEESGGLFTEINVTPLTDIFLVLLIIFMVTATGLSTGTLEVALPKVVTPASLDAAGVVTICVDAKSRFFLDQSEVPTEKLEGAMREALKKAKDPSIVLACDRQVTAERFSVALAAAGRAGAKKLALAVAREDAAAPGGR